MDLNQGIIKKIPSPYLFIFGSMLLLIVTGVYYLTIPRFEYFGAGYTIYPPGSSLPESLPKNYQVSNDYLLSKYVGYLVVYLLMFMVLYSIASRLRQLKIGKEYVWVHLALITLGFILLVYVNPLIISRQGISGYLSDVYIDNFSKEQMLAVNKMLLWETSLMTPSSVTGIVSCVLGILVFLIAIFRGWETAVDVVD